MEIRKKSSFLFNIMNKENEIIDIKSTEMRKLLPFSNAINKQKRYY